MPLVIAATPIGDPDDASPRLRAALRAADVIAAEDTRRLHRLAKSLEVDVTAKVVAVYDAVERQRADSLLDTVESGGTVLVVTDAGMPLVSDPGHVLVTRAVARGLPVTVIPGPSAVTAAIAVAGVPANQFSFEGFLPRKAGERRSRLAELATDPRALVAFESPRRLSLSLADLAAAFGADRAAAVCRELTKTHEEVRRGTLGELAEWAAAAPVLGEITLVVAGCTEEPAPVDPDALRAEVAERVARGDSRRDAVDAVASAHGLSRRVVYAVVLDQTIGPH
ncbi:MAG: 16S rRNA (cytidine(1402)-2'-O)-methyltransferase [Frankiaceae bacterium]|nr:16S rRNA (cytidine(1402)-2'-O)-methyltransferase [Frankiaceae bacterium]MBV9871918.1 16S rRNA (cytidine(1402)-2'-O)-methyltransferase [Frankiaceae bacterium]